MRKKGYTWRGCDVLPSPQCWHFGKFLHSIPRGVRAAGLGKLTSGQHQTPMLGLLAPSHRVHARQMMQLDRADVQERASLTKE